MRVYVASRWSDSGRFVARHAMDQLLKSGHVITHDWTAEDEDCADMAEAARKDLDGVYTADALLLIPMDGCKGAWVEFGVALARLMPIVVARPASDKVCIFEHLTGVIHVSTVAEAVEVLNKIGKR